MLVVVEAQAGVAGDQMQGQAQGFSVRVGRRARVNFFFILVSGGRKGIACCSEANGEN